MAQLFHYYQSGPRLEFYTEIYDYDEQHATGLSGVQPPLIRDLIPIRKNDAITFAPDETDIRGFAVNTPNGDTLGSVEGFLIDAAQSVVPYAYVKVRGGDTVVVPTNQFTVYPDLRLVVLEGGINILQNAPKAQLNKSDAQNADRYWGDIRRNRAA